MKSNSNMGKILHIDEGNHQRVCYSWDSQILPAIQKLAASYNDLGIGTFNQDVYNKIISTGINDIDKTYKTTVKAEIDKFKKDYKTLSTIVLDIDAETQTLIQFKEAYNALNVVLANNMRSSFYAVANIDMNDCKIIKGQASVNKEEIKKRFTVEIDTEDKDEFYRLLLSVIEPWNKLRSFMDQYRREGHHPDNIFIWDGAQHVHGYLTEDEKGEMVIIEKNFNDLFY